jgi:hypothetical protein
LAGGGKLRAIDTHWRHLLSENHNQCYYVFGDADDSRKTDEPTLGRRGRGQIWGGASRFSGEICRGKIILACSQRKPLKRLDSDKEFQEKPRSFSFDLLCLAWVNLARL